MEQATSSRMLGYTVDGIAVREEFAFSMYKNENRWDYLKINLYRGDTVIGRFESSNHTYKGYIKVDEEYETMEKVSKWWRSPPPLTVDWQFRRALAKLEVVPARPHGVAWLLYTVQGKLVTELRSYLDDKRDRIPYAGKLNLPSGGFEASDGVLPKTLQREFTEEHHRKLLDVGEYSLVDKAYEPADGHMIHVYNINPTYETLLLRQKGSRAALLKDLFNTEGLGHPQFWRDDLQQAFWGGHFIPYVADFFTAQPDYLPDLRPKVS